jgi:hypothetical protein
MRAVFELGLFAYCAAMGFVTAATLCSLYQWVTSQRADFSMARESLPMMVFAVVLSMFAGPYILIQRVIVGMRAREIGPFLAAAGTAVAGMWSVCAGIFYVSLLISA